MKKARPDKKLTISLDLDLAETLEGLIDGCLGASEDDNFNREMKPFLKQLSKAIAKKRTELINSKIVS
jgi:hypothetical protein